MEGIKRHPFDTILMAMNAADPHHYSFNEELLPLAVERQMGIIGMKVPGRGRLLSTGRRRRSSSRSTCGKAWSRPNARHAHHARGHVLHALAPGEHGHHRLRHDRAA
jgi:aryl-alcohol dehydrogenase-like predicted oxidoreductase